MRYEDYREIGYSRKQARKAVAWHQHLLGDDELLIEFEKEETQTVGLTEFDGLTEHEWKEMKTHREENRDWMEML